MPSRISTNRCCDPAFRPARGTDILEAKKDRLQEIKRQTIKYAKRKNWGMVNLLRREERQLKENIKQIEAIRNKVNKP